MARLIWMELKNCINKKEFKIIFMLMFVFCMVGFWVEARIKIGVNYQIIRSARECVFLQSAEGLFLLRTLNMIFPLMTSMIYAGSMLEEKQKNISGNIIMRSGKKKYIRAKAVVVFFSSFLAFVIPLLINYALCYMCFPLEGKDSMWLEPDFLIGVSAYFPTSFLDFWRIQMPFLYNLIMIFVYGICCGMVALLAYGISFCFLHKSMGKIKTVFTTTLIIIFVRIVFASIGLPEYTLQNYMTTVQKGSVRALFVVLICYGLISVVYHNGVASLWNGGKGKLLWRKKSRCVVERNTGF